MIPKLNVISIIKEIHGTAHSPLKVIGSDFKKYFLKTPKDINPEINILNEFLAGQFLNFWKLKTPSVAKLIVDKNIISTNLSINHKREYFNRTCFGSKLLETGIDFSEMISQISIRKLHNPNNFFLLALFDIWIENDDRKPSNMNLMIREMKGKYEFYAIDHAFIFSTLNYIDLNPNFGVSSSFNDSLLETSFSKKLYCSVKNKNWFTNIKKSFYENVKKCEEDFDSIIKNIPEDLGLELRHIEKIKYFLFSKNRNRKVIEEFTRRF